MPAITRKGDKSTGHDGCAPVEAVEGANNFLVNGKPVVLVGDKYASHGCLVHSPHQGQLAEGSPSFFVNGKPVGRVGDPISCGGTVAEGASNFIVGNGNEQLRNKFMCEHNEILTRYTRKRDDDIFFCLPLIADAMGNKANEKDRIGWHYLRDMFYKWLAGKANDVPQNNPNPFWVDIDWVLRYFPKEFLTITFPLKAKTDKAIRSLNIILAREGYFEKRNKEFDFINSPWQEWEKYYYQRFDVEERHLVEIGIIAALATFTFRFLPKGKIEYLGENQYKVTLEQVAIFVHDLFNFDGAATSWGDFLGYWSCEEKNVKYESITKDETYIRMSDARFRDFREYNKIGNDFLVLSKTKLIDNFYTHTYTYTYEK